MGSKGFTTHKGLQRFRGFTEPFYSSCVLAVDYNSPTAAGLTGDASGNLGFGTVGSNTTKSVLPSGIRAYTVAANGKIAITPYAAINNLTKQTVIVWVKPTTMNSAHRVLCKESDAGVGWVAAVRFTVTVAENTTFFTRSWTTGSASVTGKMNGVTLNVWNMIAMTYDGSSAANVPHSYVNGVLDTAPFATTATGSGALVDDSAINVTLMNRGASDRGFSGSTGQMWVFNDILTPAQILNVYSQTKGFYGLV